MGIIIIVALVVFVTGFWLHASLSFFEASSVAMLIAVLAALILLSCYSASIDTTATYYHLRDEVKKCNQMLKTYDLAISNTTKGSKTQLRLAAERGGILEERDKCSKEMQEIIADKIKYKASFMFGALIDMPEGEEHNG